MTEFEKAANWFNKVFNLDANRMIIDGIIKRRDVIDTYKRYKTLPKETREEVSINYNI